MRKSRLLPCDAVVFDLEDAVAPQMKERAREQLRDFLQSPNRPECEVAIRINPLASAWGTEDLLAARACHPDAILLPKVESPQEILGADEALAETDAPPSIRLWAMIETARGLLNVGSIGKLGLDPTSRLSCLVAGTNDLAKQTRITERTYLGSLLVQIVLAARAGNLIALDGVYNDFRDLDAFTRECAQGREMGFDGKTLIHPTQIEAANAAFSPTLNEIAEAESIVAAFAKQENRHAGAIALEGRMVERLHLEEAEALLKRARQIKEKGNETLPLPDRTG